MDDVSDKNAIGGRRWDVATHKRKVCDREIEIVTLIKGNMKLTIPPDRQQQIEEGSRSIALRRVFELKLMGYKCYYVSDLFLLKVTDNNLNSFPDFVVQILHKYFLVLAEPDIKLHYYKMNRTH